MEHIIETTRMSTRGQVIIPKEIRDYIHAGQNELFTVTPLDKNTIVMRKMDRGKMLADFQALRNKAAPKLTEKEIQDEIHAYRKR